ncbi:hypothetical protein MMC25_000833 [Agyrium rufum]|nr:hypothetical protein [Agyrium rufum]
MASYENEERPVYGKQAKPRPKTRELVRWNEDMDVQLLLVIQKVCNEKKIPLPWEDLGSTMDPSMSGGAIQQHLSKLRQRRVEQGLPVPEPLRRGSGPGVSRRTLASTTAKTFSKTKPPVKTRNNQVTKAKIARISHRDEIDTDVDERDPLDDDPDGSYEESPRKKSTFSGKKKVQDGNTPSGADPKSVQQGTKRGADTEYHEKGGPSRAATKIKVEHSAHDEHSEPPSEYVGAGAPFLQLASYGDTESENGQSHNGDYSREASQASLAPSATSFHRSASNVENNVNGTIGTKEQTLGLQNGSQPQERTPSSQNGDDSNPTNGYMGVQQIHDTGSTHAPGYPPFMIGNQQLAHAHQFHQYGMPHHPQFDPRQFGGQIMYSQGFMGNGPAFGHPTMHGYSYGMPGNYPASMPMGPPSMTAISAGRAYNNGGGKARTSPTVNSLSDTARPALAGVNGSPNQQVKNGVPNGDHGMIDPLQLTNKAARTPLFKAQDPMIAQDIEKYDPAEEPEQYQVEGGHDDTNTAMNKFFDFHPEGAYEDANYAMDYA